MESAIVNVHAQHRGARGAAIIALGPEGVLHRPDTGRRVEKFIDVSAAQANDSIVLTH